VPPAVATLSTVPAVVLRTCASGVVDKSVSNGTDRTGNEIAVGHNREECSAWP
jgi:hypothetical protein